MSIPPGRKIALGLAMAFLFSIFLTQAVLGAKIYGSVFDFSLEKESDVIVTINTRPAQQMIAKTGDYQFSVPNGQYTINATKRDGQQILGSVEEKIVVESDGEYVVDLILLPLLGDDENLIRGLEELDINEEDIGLAASGPSQSKAEAAGGARTSWFIIMGVFVIFILFFFLSRSKKAAKSGKETAERGGPKNEPEEMDKDEDIKRTEAEIIAEAKEEELKPYITYLREQSRTTQKDMRRQFPVSEAKISLILTELEDRDMIKKIKKGRGNIILYTGKK